MSKCGLPSAKARRNSARSPWRRENFCQTKRARESRAELDRLEELRKGRKAKA